MEAGPAGLANSPTGETLVSAGENQQIAELISLDLDGLFAWMEQLRHGLKYRFGAVIM